MTGKIAGDQAQFDDVCKSERWFVTGLESHERAVVKMNNAVNRTVGDGTLTSLDFAKVVERLARQAGPEFSDKYNERLKQLQQVYRDAKEGK
jgi:hypothetical protein